jgi:KaiC/GvpD/RAD55 family RecA-like ATPase
MQQKPEPMTPSKEAAQRIATVCPRALFCGFNVKPKPNGDSAKLPVSKKGSGVSADIDPSALVTASELAKAPDLGDYWGVVMHHPTYCPFDDLVLTILDLDTKRSDAPKDLRMKRLLDTAKEMGLLTERSHSKKGGHIIFLAKPDPSLPPKIDLGNRQEIEIFGQPKSGGKSVMLTGDNLRGDFIELPMTVTEFLAKCGIKIEAPKSEKPKAPQSPAPAPRFADNDDMARAAQALTYISLSEGDYQEWIDMGMALQAGFNDAGFQLWVNWSATQPGYKDESDCLSHWKSFKNTGGITLGSLFHKAAQNGYRPPTKAFERRSAVDDFANIVASAYQTAEEAEGENGEIGGNGGKGEIFPLISPQVPPELIKGWHEVDFDVNTLEPIEFLVDGFLAHSFSVIAGQPGVGKTTAMLAVALVAAGFQIGSSPLKCEARRKVIYVSEDTAQIRRSLYAYAAHFGLDPQELKHWFILIESKRSDVAQILELAHNVIRHTVNGERPWVVIDTANATLDIENENDNSEVGAYMAALKQTIYVQLATSIAIITHTNKHLSREDDSAMARGASAFTGDSTLTATLFQDETKNRYMKLVKTRYEPLIREVRFDTHIYTKAVVNRHGNMQDLNCVIVVPEISTEEMRQELKSEIKDQKRNQQILDKADEAFTYVQSVINSHPNGVIVKKGSGGSSTPPDSLNEYHVLSWSDVLAAVPGASDGTIKKEVKDAVFARLTTQEVAKSWYKI